MNCSGPCSVSLRTTLRGAVYLSVYLYNYRLLNFSWQIDMVLCGHTGGGGAGRDRVHKAAHFALSRQPGKRSRHSAAFAQPNPEPAKGLICDQVFHIKEDGSRELQYLTLD